MSFKFTVLFICVSLFFIYYLMSPFLANLQYTNMKLSGYACEAKLVKACFLNLKPLCFDYVNACVVPDGWYVTQSVQAGTKGI
jgi:hypothetical protein